MGTAARCRSRLPDCPAGIGRVNPLHQSQAHRFKIIAVCIRMMEIFAIQSHQKIQIQASMGVIRNK